MLVIQLSPYYDKSNPSTKTTKKFFSYLDGKLAVYRLELVLKEDNCYTPELPVEVRMVEVDLMVHQGHILVH